MFRVESHLELLTSAPGRLQEAPNIEIRGYTKEVVTPPAEFMDVAPVSVGAVVGFCPTYRDLVLIKRQKVEQTESWPRAAGRVIERVLGYAFDQHAGSTDSAPLSVAVEEITKAAEARVGEWSKKRKNATRLKELADLKVDSGHYSNDWLKRLLIDSVTLDLFHLQGSLNYKRRPDADVEKGESEKALSNLKMNPKWDPPAFIKLSQATPDFVIPKFRAIGDIKSGSWSDEYYLTATGYALAYESLYGANINLGVIYLVETEPVIFGQSRVVVFPITDAVRRRFLDRRNEALAVMMAGAQLPPRLQELEHQKKFCERCGLKAICFEKAEAEEAKAKAEAEAAAAGGADVPTDAPELGSDAKADPDVDVEGAKPG